MLRALVVMLVAAAFCVGPARAELTVTPTPSVMIERAQPGFKFTDSTVFATDSKFLAETNLIVEKMRVTTGLPLPVMVGATGGVILQAKDGLGEEGYTLESDAKGVKICATTPAGAFYGLQTLLQLMPTEIYSPHRIDSVEVWTVPSVKIEDQPRFRWRGIMIDEARHFFGTSIIKDQIDAMAQYKLNRFHWHLTDDQGWRIEISRFPQLVLNGAIRPESPRMWNRNEGDGTPYGYYFYTHDQIRDIVAYAAARHITIIPEIELPGHTLAFLSAFPALSCAGGPYFPRTTWGVEQNILCPGNDAVFVVVRGILDDVMKLFPSKMIHIGGDECPKDRWNMCPKCRVRMETLGLVNAEELQGWFTQVVANYVEAHGCKVIGWDDIYSKSLPKSVSIMSWRGTATAERAAAAGHDVVAVPNNYCYLDYSQDYPGDTFEYIGGNNRFSHVYSFDPTKGLTAEAAKHIIGVQGNLWSEYIWGRKDLEWKLWPRAVAIAEIGWSKQESRDIEDLRRRAPDITARLRAGSYEVMPRRPVQVGEWKSGQIPTEWTTLEFDVSPVVRAPGSYRTIFEYAAGRSRLVIRSVELLVNGASVDIDEHTGSTGYENVARVFTTRVGTLPPNAKVTLRASVCTDGSIDSVGKVMMTAY